MFISNAKYYIRSRIASTQGTGSTFLLSTDVERNQNLDTGGKTVSVVLKTGAQIERMEISAINGTATIVRRGLTQGDVATEDVTLNKQWNDGTTIYVSALAYDLVDKQGDVMTGALSFSGLNAGVKAPKMTNAEMLALPMASNDTGYVYNTTNGQYYQYNGGSWIAIASGSIPNASDTVSGKVEMATTAEVTAGTATGSTGAALAISPDKYIENRNAYFTANIATALETTTGSSDVKVITPLKLKQKVNEARASDAEALAGTDAVKFITPKQAKDVVGVKKISILSASDSVYVSDVTEIQTSYSGQIGQGNTYYSGQKNVLIGTEGLHGSVRIKGEIRGVRNYNGTTDSGFVLAVVDITTPRGTIRCSTTYGFPGTSTAVDSGYLPFSQDVYVLAGETISVKAGLYNSQGVNSPTNIRVCYVRNLSISFSKTEASTSFV